MAGMNLLICEQRVAAPDYAQLDKCGIIHLAQGSSYWVWLEALFWQMAGACTVPLLALGAGHQAMPNIWQWNKAIAAGPGHAQHIDCAQGAHWI
eukprot:scaffold311721_cov24-Tisochrysis_lutea.AAC.1